MYKLDELIDMQAVSSMIDNLSKITNITIFVINVQGDIIIESPNSKFCKNFHRKYPTLNHICSNNKHLLAYSIDKNPKCHLGLSNLSVPIILCKDVIGYIQLGQFFTEKPDLDFYKKKCDFYGFNEKEYFEALKEIPIVPEDKLDSYKNLITQFISTILNKDYKSLLQKKQRCILRTSNKLLENKIKEKNIELKKMNMIYKESREKYKILLDYLPDILYVLVDGKITFANKAAQLFFDLPKITDLIGIDQNDLFSVHSSDQEKFRKILDHINNGEDIPFSEIKLIRKDTNKVVNTLIGVNRYIFDDYNGFLVMIRTMEYKNRADEYSKLLNEAISYDKLKTDFFSNVSHEFLTPLNVIISALQVLDLYSKTNDLDTYVNKNEEYRKIIKKNSYRLLKLSNNMIDITKIDSGFLKLTLVPHNIVSLVKNIFCSVKHYMKENKLSFQFTKEVDELFIICDEEKIERILLNLLSNAIKFTPAGGKISVSIAAVNNYACITVKDTGIGIPLNKQKIIFERFRQVDKSFTRISEGSGIGLSLVKSLVEMQMGRIAVSSELQKGSEFRLYFPLMKSELGTSFIDRSNSVLSNVDSISIEFSDIY